LFSSFLQLVGKKFTSSPVLGSKKDLLELLFDMPEKEDITERLEVLEELDTEYLSFEGEGFSELGPCCEAATKACFQSL